MVSYARLICVSALAFAVPLTTAAFGFFRPSWPADDYAEETELEIGESRESFLSGGDSSRDSVVNEVSVTASSGGNKSAAGGQNAVSETEGKSEARIQIKTTVNGEVTHDFSRTYESEGGAEISFEYATETEFVENSVKIFIGSTASGSSDGSPALAEKESFGVSTSSLAEAIGNDPEENKNSGARMIVKVGDFLRKIFSFVFR